MNRDVVAEIGHHFAQQYGFAYPSMLEATVRRSWQDFGK
jgi:hypothetical protein